MAVLVVAQVVARNALDLGLPAADELARYACIALVYLAVPSLALRGQHVAVDILVQAAPRRLRRPLRAATEVAVLAFCAISLYALAAFLARAGKFTTPALGMPNTLFYAPAAVGFALLAAVTLARLLRLILGPSSDEGPPSGP
ncbi:MAG: TRAP transporter small permease subunit [Alphaproteobacteria bacterium]|nr:TRAP transporter small permease subunit [Alphaproteobacteria bacterium]